MSTKLLQFMDGTVLAEDGTRVGVTRNGKTQWAQNAMQANIVRQVLCTPRNPETYAAELASWQSLPPDNTEMTLQILRFILDFKDFLQSQ